MRFVRRIRDAVRFLQTYGQHLPMVLPAIVDLRCRSILLEGRARGSESTLRVVYVGRGLNFSYLSKLLFEKHSEIRCKKTLVFRYRRAIDDWLAEADLLVLDIGWPYHSRINRSGRFLEIPDWVDMGVEIDGDWQQVSRKFRRDARKNDLRRVRRGGYQCRITSDRAEIAQFYDEMYVPYVKFAHGAAATLAPRWHVVRQGSKGALLKVVSDDEVIAAGVVFPSGNVLVSLWMGLPSHLHEKPPDAAISALYVFLIRYAIDQDYRYVDFAGTRGFLNDGVYQFKRKWGAEIGDTFSPSSILLQLQNADEPTLSLIEKLPMFTRTDDGLEAVVVRRGMQPVEKCMRSIERNYGIPGLHRVNVLQLSDRGRSEAVAKGEHGIEYRISTIAEGSLPATLTSCGLQEIPVDTRADNASPREKDHVS